MDVQADRLLGLGWRVAAGDKNCGPRDLGRRLRVLGTALRRAIRALGLRADADQRVPPTGCAFHALDPQGVERLGGRYLAVPARVAAGASANRARAVEPGRLAVPPVTRVRGEGRGRVAIGQDRRRVGRGSTRRGRAGHDAVSSRARMAHKKDREPGYPSKSRLRLPGEPCSPPTADRRLGTPTDNRARGLMKHR